MPQTWIKTPHDVYPSKSLSRTSTFPNHKFNNNRNLYRNPHASIPPKHSSECLYIQNRKLKYQQLNKLNIGKNKSYSFITETFINVNVDWKRYSNKIAEFISRSIRKNHITLETLTATMMIKYPKEDILFLSRTTTQRKFMTIKRPRGRKLATF